MWERRGESSYVLNHFAYNENTDVIGVVRIRADLTVSRDGQKFTGIQTGDVYDNLRNHLQHLRGIVVGKRITIDTTAQDIR